MPGAIGLLKPSLAFEPSADPVDTSAQAALAPHKTTEQEESADTIVMAMGHVLLTLSFQLGSWKAL
jgi:hypothetical protein